MCCSASAAQERQPQHVLILDALVLVKEGKGKANEAFLLPDMFFWRSKEAEVPILL